MQPPKRIYEYEISAAIERREEKCRALQDDDREIERPDSWQMTTLKTKLCGDIYKSLDYCEKEFKTYEELRSAPMRWAINQEIENEVSEDDPMDCNKAQYLAIQSSGIGRQAPGQQWSQQQQQQPPPTVPPTDVNYKNLKGKAKQTVTQKEVDELGIQAILVSTT